MSLLTSAICEAQFGDPTPDFERKWMAKFTTSVGPTLPLSVIPAQLYCHRLFIQPFRDALELVHDRKLGLEIKSFDGCFNIRSKKGGSTPSIHSWGLAVDLNAAWNQFLQPPTMSLELVRCFTDVGFDWGGVWKKLDGMHFQLSAEALGRGLAKL